MCLHVYKIHLRFRYLDLIVYKLYISVPLANRVFQKGMSFNNGVTYFCGPPFFLLFLFILCLPGKKWKSLLEERQHKYRSEYQGHYKEYKLEMARFLDEHPEAKR